MLVGYLLIAVVIFFICLSNRVGFLPSLGYSAFWPGVVACIPVALVVVPFVMLCDWVTENVTGWQFFWGYLAIVITLITVAIILG